MSQPPSWQFLLGTDQFGRDIFSRIIYGARTALLVGFVASFVGCFVGLVLGVGSAYFGGYIDLAFERFLDISMSFPIIILALAMVENFGTDRKHGVEGMSKSERADFGSAGYIKQKKNITIE